MDDEVSGTGNQYDYGFRIYNPRLGRFLSVDPLSKSYPMLTPYQFASNSTIACIDLDGLESVVSIKKNSTTTYAYSENGPFPDDVMFDMEYAIPAPVLQKITDIDAVEIVINQDGTTNYNITQGYHFRADKNTGRPYKEYSERSFAGKVAIQLLQMTNSFTLIGTSYCFGLIGNYINEIKGEYPEWAYPYKWNNRGQFEKQKDLFYYVDCEGTKELIVSNVEIMLTPLKIANTGAKLIDKSFNFLFKETTKKIVEKSLEKVPCDSPIEK